MMIYFRFYLLEEDKFSFDLLLDSLVELEQWIFSIVVAEYRLLATDVGEAVWSMEVDGSESRHGQLPSIPHF